MVQPEGHHDRHSPLVNEPKDHVPLKLEKEGGGEGVHVSLSQ